MALGRPTPGYVENQLIQANIRNVISPTQREKCPLISLVATNISQVDYASVDIKG